MDRLLDVLLFGDTTRSYHDLWAGYENVSSRRLDDVGDLYQGPNMPRPTLTGYRGFQGYKADESYYFEDGGWVNCVDGSAWEGK